jgi:DNA (cytosine-5)-methyltransferase 1
MEACISPKVVDLFCGAGGLSAGFRAAGFKIIAGVDNWRPAAKFEFRDNLPFWAVRLPAAALDP